MGMDEMLPEEDNYVTYRAEPHDVIFTATPCKKTQETDWYVYDMSGWIVNVLGKAPMETAQSAAEKLDKLFKD